MNHFKHRCDVVDYMVEPFVEDGMSFNRYTARLKKMGTHAGNDTIVAFAKIHDLNVVIHQLDRPTLIISGAKVSKTAHKVHIAHHNGGHYVSVRRIGVKTIPPTKSQEQHKCGQGKTRISTPSHVDDVPKLNVVKETHHKLKKAGDKHQEVFQEKNTLLDTKYKRLY